MVTIRIVPPRYLVMDALDVAGPVTVQNAAWIGPFPGLLSSDSGTVGNWRLPPCTMGLSPYASVDVDMTA